jgi:asparagine synthase (glutamine-hydrolysing)
MCGICGIASEHDITISEATVERMVASLAHRGPDSAGAVLLERAALAMARLAIIDRAGGEQPMASDDERLWLVFNGEVYNFGSLREELELLGHAFHTRSDTEVILRAYEQWGDAAVTRLKGMFAFALFDRRARRLLLARDRLGKKPLFYWRGPSELVFGSEIKAILQHPAVPREVNRAALPLFLAYGYIPDPETIFAGIHELPPGHTLVFTRGDMLIRPYWQAANLPAPDLPADQRMVIPLVREALEAAVRVRLVADVPLGAFLSGGLDSTAVVAMMANISDQPVKTFAIGFEGEPSFNELEHARLAANTFGTDHREFVVRPDAAELLPQLVWHYDQPFADSSAIPTFLVSKLAREHVTVALTGDGGDELFAGYDRFAAMRVSGVYRRLPAPLRSAVLAAARSMPESTSYRGPARRIRRFAESAALPFEEAYLDLVALMPDHAAHELLAEATTRTASAHTRAEFARVPHLDALGKLLHVNLRTYLAGDLLVKLDRASMAASLEARSPLLDEDLLALAARIPSGLKLHGLTTKQILKRAMVGIVPQAIVDRRKHGFGVPLGRWFRGPLAPLLDELLLGERALRRGFLRPDPVRRLVEEHRHGRRDHGHRLWSLLTFETWHRIFIDREIEEWSFATQPALLRWCESSRASMLVGRRSM